MDGTTLQGNMKGLNKDEISKGEKFVIEKVNKVAGETWLFQMRFQYGAHDVPVPVPIRVTWAGDTPVLTLTDVPIPGYGTYTARVLIYGEQYAGMWSSQKGGGGQVFGKVLRNRDRRRQFPLRSGSIQSTVVARKHWGLLWSARVRITPKPRRGRHGAGMQGRQKITGAAEPVAPIAGPLR